MSAFSRFVFAICRIKICRRKRLSSMVVLEDFVVFSMRYFYVISVQKRATIANQLCLTPYRHQARHRPPLGRFCLAVQSRSSSFANLVLLHEKDSINVQATSFLLPTNQLYFGLKHTNQSTLIRINRIIEDFKTFAFLLQFSRELLFAPQDKAQINFIANNSN